jgi:hypothetical protein
VRLPLVPSLVALGCALIDACGAQTPSSPSVLPTYFLDMTASPACAERWIGTAFTGAFRFQMVLANAGAETLFQLPNSPQLSGANSGSLTLKLHQEAIGVTGELSGSGVASDGSHVATITGGDVLGAANATVSGTGTIGVTPVSGVFDGKIVWTLSGSTTVGACTAAGHQWQLTRR